ncbi:MULTISPECIES: ParB/RepB/Spo0J family partition protein [Rhodobacterales]|uniref:ParB/RepB/Spo0J family partition protein n=1 Tax=Rhodobacterales TaxID=204455 RepID=UPI00237EF9C1|nr:ParB N-terminal domain-containing protein [Phaeobacter gallaeciensis]MDE4097190.1 ParB N-terminal domain-containing protein [Phaeobacter gallaeciensis]MDE4106296.1 ParB N-terminal domain-containing protein [Phaeobacter gallaeciensis]MDE4112894.1 ParB N-terminal domain-containing protein [Phaeobacter gallaeciensis]MDE4114925.1 ParB N-terminal domain-containing protein [Phaeobacter gallaeciensis]MDE4119393.1 ParB N-terminal domain-containing protein [Phaeobacter gallaeciensis]
MSKRRVFDIDFPEDSPAPAPAEPPRQNTAEGSGSGAARRGPMATAITENADALRQRADAEKTIRAENDRLAHEFVRLKKLGLVVDRIPLGKIRTDKLVRDRSVSRDPELDELKDSIRSIGLSNPIRVEEDGGVYQLVQGFRRLSAYRALLEETGDDTFAAIPAGLVAKGETLQGLYRRMVDENLVRRDISFAEMAQLAVSYAQDPETEADSIDEAVRLLYASAGRQKRSYIRHFADLLLMIGTELTFPEAIPRALGLDLKKRLADDPKAQAQLQAQLRSLRPDTAEAELVLLRGVLTSPTSEASSSPAGGTAPKSASAKTTLRCAVPAGTVRCQARDGKIEMAMERDFSAIDRRRLEEAISAFFTTLDRGAE